MQLAVRQHKDSVNLLKTAWYLLSPNRQFLAHCKSLVHPSRPNSATPSSLPSPFPPQPQPQPQPSTPERSRCIKTWLSLLRHKAVTREACSTNQLELMLGMTLQLPSPHLV